MKPCFFFDRDGIVNESPGEGRYVERWEDFRLMPAFPRLLKRVQSAGYAAVVVTNQRCVALGRISRAELDAMHARFRRTLREAHAVDVTDILVCPHDQGVCTCRKPQPGLLLEAARRHDLDLASSWMVGDRETDVEAGRAAGCGTILVRASPAASAARYVVESLDALDSLIAAGRLVM